MAKKADRYFEVNPWKIVETHFDPAYAKVAESIFALGNEYMGVRGYFDEGGTTKSLTGSYFNGIYERENLGSGGYKGVVNDTEFMVNAVNWLAVKVIADGETLDLAKCKIEDYRRSLDLKTGLLKREFIWVTGKNVRIRLRFERLLAMEHTTEAVQKITAESVDFDGELQINLESDFGMIHQMHQKNYWDVQEKKAESTYTYIAAKTIHTDIYLFSGSVVCGESNGKVLEAAGYVEEKKAGVTYQVSLKPGKQAVFIKKTWNGMEDMPDWREQLSHVSYESILAENEEWWSEVWKKSDIEIYGDEENQQGIRYCIFQMMQTYHGAKAGNNIGAKGLTGEAYNGNAFWDTETYCLPVFLFNNRKAAKNLLLFRYQTLGEAKKRAEALDCKGAFYPIATISGRECCNLWQHASLQLQASTGVAYGIWIYEKVTKDREFIEQYGAEMLVEISRMLATRGDWSADGTKYGYYCVMGPDEFQMMVNHNCYTNFMGKFTFVYTLRVLNEHEGLAEKFHVTKEEQEDWKKKAEAMLLPYDENRQIFEQHDGFFKLPHVDVDAIPMEEFPLYHHWSYDRIYRNDMIKQPDVLMFMLLFNHAFTKEQLLANYEFYEPKCIHESSLSPSVHSILAAQLKKKKEAFDFFGFATRMDLDNYNRNTEEGLHTTSIAAAWMNIVYGFGGMRSDDEILAFSPTIPICWNGYRFRVETDNGTIIVNVKTDRVEMTLESDRECEVLVYGEKYILSSKRTEIAIPEEWR